MSENMPSQDMTTDGDIKRKKPPTAPRTPKKITEKYFHNSGLAYLQRFPTSTSHFKRVMLRKIDRSCKAHAQQSRDDCVLLLDKAVESFQRMGMLNDELYMTGMITSLRRRGLSKQAIMAKLQSKGLASSDITEQMTSTETDSGTADLTAALILARRKRLGPFQSAREIEPRKVLASFGRAGFGYDIAQQVMNLDHDEAIRLLQENA